VVVTAGVVTVFAVLNWYMLELQPAKSAASDVGYTLPAGTKLPALSNQLQQKGIIRSAAAFTVYVTLSGQRRNLEAGSYDLNPSSSVAEVANVLSQGKITHNQLVVPEGVTVAKVRALAATKGITPASFNAALGESYTGTFLAGRPPGDYSLEGYLFPDSYQLPPKPDAHTLIQAMLTNFEKQETANNLTQAFAAENLSLHQGVTLTSIVQSEVSNEADQSMVAQVFLNRLAAGIPLQSDVTVAYAALLTGQPFSTTLVSPYNTYVNKGLPPGPIANPGITALEAVAHPTPNSYLYFVADKNGVTHYATTYAEHEQNVQKYLQN
jgi:UPF0755 protein